jgi:hypothetical protein
LLLFLASLLPSLCAQERYLGIVFGPATPETARRGAHAAADAARRWLQNPGAVVELRRAGSPDSAQVDSRTLDGVDQLFADVAARGREADPTAFLTALDAAAQAAAAHSGARLVAAVLNGPPWSSDGERTLATLVDFCRSKGVRVVVLDIAAGGGAEDNAALKALATRTGGLWLREAKGLESSLMMLAPGGKAAPQTAPAPAPASAPAPAPAPQSGGFPIPLYARFIRTSGTGSVSSGTLARQLGNADARGTPTLVANATTGPLKGMLLVEAPLNALKFETDDKSDTYHARALINAVVRNSKGVAVWTGGKEVVVRGPMPRLERRRQGVLYFMRDITLLAGDQYTLEATIQDELAGSGGAVTAPVRPPEGAPGLMASDALAVRRFTSAADKFDADQVFSYEGEALAPLLHPVYDAEKGVNLRLFLVIYPDIDGPQPDMHLELMRDGHPVARAAVAFKSQIRNSELGNMGAEGVGAGAPSGGSAIGGAIPGARAREFPYLASVNGAKLSPGAYDAVVTVRQGRNVITRTVPFQVTGNAETAGGPGAAGAGADTEAEVVLPEIEPATVDSSGLAIGSEEQERLWSEAAKSVLGYSKRLPNFRCSQETRRFVAPVRTPGQLKESDSFKDDLTYEDGRESYRTVEVNGEKTEKTREELKGVRSSGEFGTMLRGLFEPETGVTHKWAGRAMAMGVLCQVFQVAVDQAHSNLTLVNGGRYERVGYAGRVFIDEDTGLVRRLTIQGAGLPKDFALQSPAFSLDYGMVRIGSDDYLLPLRSVLQLRQTKLFVRNETVFRSYRRLEGQSVIKYQDR